MVDALASEGLLHSTLIVVTAKHGQSPIDNTLVKKRDGDAIAALVDAAAPVAGHIEDDVGALLADRSQQGGRSGAAALKAAPADGARTTPRTTRLH